MKSFITTMGSVFIALFAAVTLFAPLSHARSNSCHLFLKPNYNFPFEEWPISSDYITMNTELQKIKKEDSVRKVVTLFNSFKEGYHARYDKYLEALLARHPDLARNRYALRMALEPLYKLENKVLLAVNKTLLEFSTKKRFHYLKSLSVKRLQENDVLLDALIGLDPQAVDSEVFKDISTNGVLDRKKQKKIYGYESIYPETNELTQSSWGTLIRWLEEADLKEGQVITDLGSGMGRLGFLIAILRPDLQFIGVEIAAPRVRMANEIIRQSGITNLTFLQAHLGDPHFEIPPADHIYLFNPTIPDTSETLADKIVKLASTQKVQIHVNHKFDSYIFSRHFHEVDHFGAIKTFEYHR